MGSKEELAFIKAHLEEISPKILRQLNEEIAAKKRKAAAQASANAQGSGQQRGSARQENPVSQQKSRNTAAKCKATELNSFNSGGSMEPTARRSGTRATVRS
jgi:hypothetical protein